MIISKPEDLQGLTKEQFLLVLDNNELNVKQIKTIINSMKFNQICQQTNELKIGDIVTCRLRHPSLVIKIKNNLVYSVLLTTEETTEGILMKSNSRFFTTSYLTNTVVVHSLTDSISRFIGLYDNNKDIIEIKKKLKEFYKQLF